MQSSYLNNLNPLNAHDRQITDQISNWNGPMIGKFPFTKEPNTKTLFKGVYLYKCLLTVTEVLSCGFLPLT